MFVHICMLTQVYELLITHLHFFSINCINVLSNYRCIRYFVFPALFPSMSIVFIDYTCITSVTEYSKSVGLLLNELKFLIMVAYTIFIGHFTYVTLIIALNIQAYVSNTPIPHRPRIARIATN